MQQPYEVTLAEALSQCIGSRMPPLVVMDKFGAEIKWLYGQVALCAEILEHSGKHLRFTLDSEKMLWMVNIRSWNMVCLLQD